MGFLMGILGSIGLISNTGAATAAAVESSIVTNPPVYESRTMQGNIFYKALKFGEEIETESIPDYLIIDSEATTIESLTTWLTSSIESLTNWLVASSEAITIENLTNWLVPAIEGTEIESNIYILAPVIASEATESISAISLTTAIGVTLGASLVTAGVAYGGYYAYQHWDEIKDYANQSVNTVKNYGYSAYQHWDEVKDYVNQSVNTIKSYWPW